MTKVDEMLATAQDTLTVRRVYGEPYEKNGVTIIPAAALRGGGGGGEGEADEAAHGHGSGGGFGMTARPVGAYEIKGDTITWVPAADTTKVIVMSEVLVIVGLLVLRSVLRTRRRSIGRQAKK